MDISSLDLRNKVIEADELVPVAYYDGVRKEWMGVIAGIYRENGKVETCIITIGTEQSKYDITQWCSNQIMNYINEDYSDVPDMYERGLSKGAN